MYELYVRGKQYEHVYDDLMLRQAQEGDMEAPEMPPMDEVLRDEVNFIQNVSQFYNQEALSDIVLRVSEDTYYGHKFVLAKSSDVFRTMLYEKNWSQDGKDTIELSESAECKAVFDKFLRYLYTAEVCISTASAVGILCLADKYNVTSLKGLCTKYMIENSKSPRVANALTWYPWAKALNLEDLLKQCTQTIAWNYVDVMHHPDFDWVNMDLDFLGDTLVSSELIVANEYSLWEAVSRWLLHDSHEADLEANAKKLLPLLRFPQMLVSQLYSLEHTELAGRKECRELLHQLMSQAYRFRALCPAQAQLGVSFNESFYLSRDYTDLTVDNVRMQNTLRFGIQVDVKMYKGPVPSEARDADWKITYRKQGDTWSLLLYCHETAMVNSEARIQPIVLVYNEQEKVVQVHREPMCVCTRGSTYIFQAIVSQGEQARNMAVLIKPLPS